ncbi:MAG: hypothetical protein GYA43_00005 [Bacteroidales bacterium]|nr:hypothetical protein [Bacteroidales bacterium]
MNNVTKEKISTAIIKACEDEGLMYKDAAKIFNTEHLYFTYLKNPKYWDTIPRKVWDKFHAWLYSGKKLKEYKIPENYEEAQTLADAAMANAINEEMAAILNTSGAVIIEPAEEPKIKVKPEALAKRKKELKAKKLKLKPIPVTEKPKRKYTRKPKENPPEITQKILDDAPVPAGKYYAEAVPEGTSITPIPAWKADAVIHTWLGVCPERQMVDETSLRFIAEGHDVPFAFAKEVIEKEIANDLNVAKAMIESSGRGEMVSNPDLLKSEETETDFLKSEIKTLAFLLAKEHEDNERLRAEVGYLNAKRDYREKGILEAVEERWKKAEDFYKDNLERRNKENEELEQAFLKLKYRGFWARVFNRPVK